MRIMLAHKKAERGGAIYPELAKSHNTESVPTPNKGNLRATGESKIVKNPQPTELQELIDMILAENQKTERGGFEPPVL